jgi:two-component system sensor histidine kinase YesM
MINKIYKGKIESAIMERLKDFKNVGLGTKLILSYVLIIAVPICIFAVIAFTKFENSSEQDIINKNIYQLELEKVNINRNADLLERTAQMVISNKKLMDYVEVPSEISLEELVEFNEGTNHDILQLQYSNPTISDINFYSNNKNLIEIWPLVLSENRINNKDWYNKTRQLNGQVLWEFNTISDSVYDKYGVSVRNYDPVVSVCRSVDEPHNIHIGTIRVSMPSNIFFSKMYNDTKETGGQIFIVDKNNNIYTNDNSRFNLDNSLNKDMVLKEFMKYKDSGVKSFDLNYDKKHMIVVYTKIDAIDSYMVSVASLDSMLNYTGEIRNFFILGTIFLIIVLSIVTYFITGIILKRLYIIIQSMKKMQQGDFDIEIPVRSNDEIGQLAHHFRKMLRKINELIQEAVNKRSATKEAELRALQTQIDSHFIYNTLENIKMMAEIEGQYLISDSFTSLGAMMRYMKWNSEYTSLTDEMKHIKNYIALMNIRFDNKIRLVLEVDDNLMEHELLKMSLQPLVENALKYGLREVSESKDGEVRIKAKKNGAEIKIEVIDNGIGIEANELVKLNEKISNISKAQGDIKEKEIEEPDRKDSTGIGLKNVSERIKLFYGDEYGLEVFSEVNSYTKVIMTLPY